jgi:O-antigen/teichoic acid export membrane protein
VTTAWVRQWTLANRVLLLNVASLMSTTAANAALGVLYWWLAARLFAPEAVGLASAALSAMTLLGSAGMLGLGTLLIGEIPRRRGHAGALISGSVLLAGAVSVTAGILFAVLAPGISPDLSPLALGPGSVALFAAGVALTAVVFVLDDAVIGLLRGELQFWRNLIFAAAKLVLLPVAAISFAMQSGMAIYLTWAAGNAVSLLALYRILGPLWGRIGDRRPDWALLRRLGRPAVAHHALNLALQAPGLILPLVVTAVLSTTANASFYVAWMIASLVGFVAAAFTTVLYAVGSADPSALAYKIRLTLRLSFVVVLLGVGAVLLAAGPILGVFGSVYASQAEHALRVLALGAVPGIIKAHYVAIQRIRGRIAGTAALMGAAVILEIAAATLGARLGGLEGLSLCWLAVVSCEAALMTWPVYRSARSARGVQSTRPAETDAGT